MTKLLEAQIHDEPSFGAPQPFAKVVQSMEGKNNGEEENRVKKTAAVFFRTFKALPEVYFFHAIYHLKAQEVKNPTIQTVYDLELK